MVYSTDLNETIQLTVIVPAYNESSSIGETIESLHEQTMPPAEIIVVDDCSTDGTGDAARQHGVTVVRPPTNTGSKAGAQTFALRRVRTPYVMAVDADTVLAPDAIEKLLAGLDAPDVGAACGFVVPRSVETIWERGRYIEYLLAFAFYKPIQNYFEKPLISSGCFSAYRTEILRRVGGWSNRTLAEDMDLTWTLYQRGYRVRFVPGAVCYPIEPRTLDLMRKQLRRWSHGFVQNVRLHWRSVLGIPVLRWFIAVAFVDALLSSLYFLLLLPLLALTLAMPGLLLLYAVDLTMILVPVLYQAAARREMPRALASMPAFLPLRLVNSAYFLEAVWSELVRGQSFKQYEKGH